MYSKMGGTKMKLFNTLTRKTEDFNPIEDRKVRLYTCGPTVYNFAHIGNLRTYLFEDVLRRTLESVGYEVRHVMNITDVGHLQSDDDWGEDKMIVAAQRESRSPWDVARYYEQMFFNDCAELNILPPHFRPRATEHIDDIIEFVLELERMGYAYNVDGNVYFDIGKYPDYSQLANLRLDKLLEGARVQIDARKKNPLDFVLWFSQSKYPNQIMKWNSPWGVGFPGWHIECSVMASKYLGERIDIHCGGIDHIPVHHTNERAQSEARFGHRWVNIWMHGEFLLMEEEKMSKSSGKLVTLRTLKENGFEVIHYRYFCLMAHYRSPFRFTFETLSAARNTFERLKNLIIGWKLFPNKTTISNEERKKSDDYRLRFWDAMGNDLNTPVALSVLWEAVRDPSIGSRAKLDLVLNFDDVLGLEVANFQRPKLATDIMEKINMREEARKKRDWVMADAIRRQLFEVGIQIKDTPDGQDWYIVYDD